MKGELLHGEKSGLSWVTRVYGHPARQSLHGLAAGHPLTPYPLSLALFSATAVTCMTAMSVPAMVQLQEHTPQQAVWVALPSISKALHKALSMLLESSFLPLFHKTNFYRSVALCPQRQAAREKGRCVFTPGPGTYYVPQI